MKKLALALSLALALAALGAAGVAARWARGEIWRAGSDVAAQPRGSPRATASEGGAP